MSGHCFDPFGQCIYQGLLVNLFLLSFYLKRGPLNDQNILEKTAGELENSLLGHQQSTYGLDFTYRHAAHWHLEGSHGPSQPRLDLGLACFRPGFNL